ncbi:SDR family NAD(P)-dependent oxidoreductase [Streptomyces sp. NBC_01314]|uniref:SDR family NAD(P)-dependent oxidoreductase n=1 Tax=Streptomyces sp. NBC_01314 TaxID=2903821 RepID=UPI0030856B14|nr:SDR family NAD(P)-dependent oxidoreductase [Streptomyces sp. NBC_01314]
MKSAIRLRYEGGRHAKRLGTGASYGIGACRSDRGSRPRTCGPCGARHNILVNNAGAGLGRSFEYTSWADEQRMLTLNVVAPTSLLHAALPAMLGRGTGGSSTSRRWATGPVWQGTTYGASKAFGLAPTESLAYSRRLRTSPVTVTALVLGHTTSRFHERAGIAPSPPLLTLPGSADDFTVLHHGAVKSGGSDGEHGVLAAEAGGDGERHL